MSQSRRLSYAEAVKDYRRRYLREVLYEAEWNVKRAATLAGTCRSHLYRQMKSLGVEMERPRRAVPRNLGNQAWRSLGN